MKLRWYDRILVSLSGLVLALLGVLVMLAAGGVVTLPEPLALNAWLGDGWQWMPVVFLAGLLLIAWGGRLFLRPLLRRSEASGRYYAVSGGEPGVQISVQAIDHLVRKCLEQWPEILSSQVKIGGQEDSMHLTLRVALRSGVRIPELLREVRERIKAYLEECSGVAVQGVRVIVEATKDEQAAKPDLKLLPGKREEPARAPADFYNTGEVPVLHQAPAEPPAAAPPPAPEAAPEPDYQPVVSVREEEMPAPAEPEVDFGPVEPLPVTLSSGAFPFPAGEGETAREEMADA